jgi:hypothetical protein
VYAASAVIVLAGPSCLWILAQHIARQRLRDPPRQFEPNREKPDPADRQKRMSRENITRKKSAEPLWLRWRAASIAYKRRSCVTEQKAIASALASFFQLP